MPPMDALLMKTKTGAEQGGKETETKISGAEALLRCLVAEGVETISGYPGGAIMPVYDALYHYSDRLNHILVRHEEGAIHAAKGVATVRGKTGDGVATVG